jgi:CMP-N-acetylneuraminic acid synthetase
MTAKVAVQIPVKCAPSERVVGKNFRALGGVPLAARFIAGMLDGLADEFYDNWDLWLDTEDFDAASQKLVPELNKRAYTGFLRVHDRSPRFAEPWSNGNHLLTQFACAHPDYDYYVQCFVTAPFLRAETVRAMVEALIRKQSLGHDFALLVTPAPGLYWDDTGASYDATRPEGFGRLQDSPPMRETTGAYVVTRDDALRLNRRVGDKPLLYPCPPGEDFDLDDEADWAEAVRRVEAAE